MNRIELGDKVRDTVTGFVGTAIGRTKWLFGCDRIVVQPAAKKDGTLGSNESFDEPSLEIVKKAKPKPEEKKPTGGPRDTPSRYPSIKR